MFGMRVPKRVEVFLEFLIFGVAMGVAEDVIAVKFATGQPITWDVVWIVILVAVPFAAFGELVVDRVEWLKTRKKNKQS